MARLAPQRPTPPRTSYATSRMRGALARHRGAAGRSRRRVFPDRALHDLGRLEMRDGRRGHRPLLVGGVAAIILARSAVPIARSRAVDAPGGLCYGTTRVTTRSRVCPERGQEGRRCET